MLLLTASPTSFIHLLPMLPFAEFVLTMLGTNYAACACLPSVISLKAIGAGRMRSRLIIRTNCRIVFNSAASTAELCGEVWDLMRDAEIGR